MTTSVSLEGLPPLTPLPWPARHRVAVGVFAVSIGVFFCMGLFATFPHVNPVPGLINGEPTYAQTSRRGSLISATPLFLTPYFLYLLVRSLGVSYACSATALVEFHWGRPVKAVEWAEVDRVDVDWHRKGRVTKHWLVLHTQEPATTMTVDPGLRQIAAPVVERIQREIAFRPELLDPEVHQDFAALLHQHRQHLRSLPPESRVP